MGEVGKQREALARFAGLAIGIVVGSVLGPIAFGPFGMHPPAAAALGCLAGALAGYLVVSLALLVRRRRRDAEIRRAAEAVKAELRLPDTVAIKVRDGRIILSGEVEDYTRRLQAEQAMFTIPGHRGVTNEIRLRPSGDSVSASPAEIRQQIAERLLRQAEFDAGQIRVQLRDSRVVLEGTVHSWAEVSDAEDVAWTIPGIVEVENRLQVAA